MLIAILKVTKRQKNKIHFSIVPPELKRARKPCPTLSNYSKKDLKNFLLAQAKTIADLFLKLKPKR